MKYSIFILAVVLAVPAFADFSTNKPNKAMVCYGPDNLQVMLDAGRGSMTVYIEGEGGPAATQPPESDGHSYIVFRSSTGSVTFSDHRGDYFLWASDDEANPDNRLPLTCE